MLVSTCTMASYGTLLRDITRKLAASLEPRRNSSQITPGAYSMLRSVPPSPGLFQSRDFNMYCRHGQAAEFRFFLTQTLALTRSAEKATRTCQQDGVMQFIIPLLGTVSSSDYSVPLKLERDAFAQYLLYKIPNLLLTVVLTGGGAVNNRVVPGNLSHTGDPSSVSAQKSRQGQVGCC